MDRCCVCLRQLPQDPVLRERLTKAYGRDGQPMVHVHRDQCDAQMQSMMSGAASMALHGGRLYLREKYPRISGMVEKFAALRRAAADQEVTNGPG